MKNKGKNKGKKGKKKKNRPGGGEEGGEMMTNSREDQEEPSCDPDPRGTHQERGGEDKLQPNLLDISLSSEQLKIGVIIKLLLI